MRFPPIDPKNVVVTGCSSGIGLSAALWLQQRGWHVIPTARAPADLQALHRRGFSPVALDLTDSAAVCQAARECVSRFGGRPGGLVNNAGFGQVGAVEDLSREALRRQFEVNVFGLQELTNELLPAMIERGQGRIVNISSVLGRVCMPYRAAYCASKFALEALSDGLRVELRGTGVAVSLIEPGPIESRFHDRAAESAQHELQPEQSRHAALFVDHFASGPDTQKPALFRLPPGAVARRIAHALESPRPRRRYPVTIPAHAAEWMRRLAPDAVLDWLMARSMRAS